MPTVSTVMLQSSSGQKCKTTSVQFLYSQLCGGRVCHEEPYDLTLDLKINDACTS